MAEFEHILAPADLTVAFHLNQAQTMLHSMFILTLTDYHAELPHWVQDTAAQMTQPQREINDVAHRLGMMIATEQTLSQFEEIPPKLAEQTEEQIRQWMLQTFQADPQYPGDDVMLSSEEAFLAEVQRQYSEKYVPEERDEWLQRYHYARHAAQTRDDSVQHLQTMWEKYLRAEWEQVHPMLAEVVRGFEQIEFRSMNPFDAVEKVTGRNLRGSEKMERHFASTTQMIFLPNAHLGPYISWLFDEETQTTKMFFGARLPKEMRARTGALTRSELLVRLNALADETRLKILELLTENDELCAQDFIDRLGLSQSSASRHLRQLTASGYLSERRRDVAKCYSLNTERISDTLQALGDFLQPRD